MNTIKMITIKMLATTDNLEQIQIGIDTMPSTDRQGNLLPANALLQKALDMVADLGYAVVPEGGHEVVSPLGQDPYICITVKPTHASLQQLTGQESGIVIYREEDGYAAGLLCNWSTVDGLPIADPLGTDVIGIGGTIPHVDGVHVSDLSPYLDSLTIQIVAEYDPNSPDFAIRAGTVYDLGNGVIIIAPDGWI